MNLPEKYFPDLSARQSEQFVRMEELYREWNAMINVISRKDIAQFALHHMLHSLAIAKVAGFKAGTRILDAGTGGGFPGIPLAVLFPEVHFTLVDSIGKKIKVIDAVANALELRNVETRNTRFETVRGAYDFVTGRAVSRLPLFAAMVQQCIRPKGINSLPNGILYLTGGEIEQDLTEINARSDSWNLSDFFDEPYFLSKRLIHLHHFKPLRA